MRFLTLSIFLLLTLLLSQSVLSSASINLPSSLAQRTFYFSPGMSYDFQWSVSGAPMLEVFLDGDLAEYGVINDPDPLGGARAVSWTLTLPDELAPGKHLAHLTVREAAAGGTVGGRAAVSGTIIIISLYPGPYLDGKLKVDPVSVGEKALATIDLTSWSELDLADVYADVQVFGPENEVLVTTRSEHVAIPSQESVTLKVSLPTEKLVGGSYRVKATIHGGQEGLAFERSFLVGVLDLSLLDYTKELSLGRINKFSFSLNSNWNKPIEGVYAFVKLAGMEEKTATVSFDAFGKQSLAAYIDLSDVEAPGMVDGEIIAFFPDGENNMISKSFPISVDIITGDVAETQLTADDLKKERGLYIPLNTMTMMYVVILLLAIIIAILLFKKPKKEER